MGIILTAAPALMGCGITATQSASGRTSEYATELDGEWRFMKKKLTLEDAVAADYSGWESVSLPHTWNAADGEDGGSYIRSSFWYEKEVEIAAPSADKRYYIEFLGANTKTTLYVNGVQAGDTHRGGYTAFRYDITDYIQAGTNTLLVNVDNRQDQAIAPISGDFNMYGGLYRRVYLVEVNDVHIDLEDNGSSGVYLVTGNMRSLERPDDLGTFTVRTGLTNASETDRSVTVKIEVTGDNAPDAVTETVIVPAMTTLPYERQITVNDPTLWEGIDNSYGGDNTHTGYMYEVRVTLMDGNESVAGSKEAAAADNASAAAGTAASSDNAVGMAGAEAASSFIYDEVTERIGFRYFYIDTADDGESGTGFYLNGKKHPLRGVNRHSFVAGDGSAMKEEQHAADMDIILELGANAIRLCHYPQTDAFYDLCDANGIVVWTEIPVVNMVGSSEEFTEVTRQQLTELISQQYNRPSVIFWGLENEIGNGTDLNNATADKNVAKAKALLYALDGLAHELDTTGRYTTQAVNRDYAMDGNVPESVNSNFENNKGWKSDIVAWNIYPGWYPDANFYGTFEEVMERKSALDSRAMGISEYGWGANVSQHEENPVLGVNDLNAGGTWHPEEYQCLENEEALSYINAHDELWGAFYWVMFDFAVDGRNEGSQIALNDKGLVTADRSVKKDSFYLYKANWNKRDTFVYIAGRRFTKRTEGNTTVRVYSNCDSVSLALNGTELGEMTFEGNGVFTYTLALESAVNTLEATGTRQGSDTVFTDSYTFNLVGVQDSLASLDL